MATNFSAGPQMLGYLHQVRYALYSLLADQRGDTMLYVEDLDDVAKKSQGIDTLEQLKHHTVEDATINEFSSELWSTLRVWFTSWDEGKLKPEEARLCLITTATAQAGSSVAKLRAGAARDVKGARERLMEIAIAGKNKALTDAFEALLAETHTGKERSFVDIDRLLDVVVVIDQAMTIDQVAPKIKQLIIGIHSYNLDALYNRLEGWWFDKVVKHLLGGSEKPISQYEVKEQVAEIGYSLHPESLPIDYEDYELTPLQETEGKSRLFVQQLGAINIVGARLYNAVVDYYRAFEQRSKWTRDTLLIDDDLLKYEKRLVREYQRQMAILESKMALTSDAEHVRFGTTLLDWMELTANIPIRREMPVGHEYVMRGSFHMLADEDAPRVLWHPKFLEQLATILKTA
jgi:hypothetical protein